MEINIETETKELQSINNKITLLMKKKKAIQKFIKDETDRLTGIKSLETRIIELYNDPQFIKEHGRKRYYWEIGQIVGYSQSSIQRIFDNQKKHKEKDL